MGLYFAWLGFYNQAMTFVWNNHEREFPIPGIPGNTGLQFPSRKSGMEFATRIPVPENGNGIFHLHSRSRKWEWSLPLAFPFPKMGMEFSIFIPVPEDRNGIFLGISQEFHGNSRSRKWGMEFSSCIPFPNIGNGIFHSHSRS